MKKLPKELKKYLGPITPFEEAFLHRIWKRFQIEVMSEQWNLEPIEELIAYCQEVLGVHFNVPEDKFYKFVNKRTERSSEAKAIAACRNAVKVLKALEDKPTTKRKKIKIAWKSKARKVAAKATPKPSQSIILRKGNRG